MKMLPRRRGPTRFQRAADGSMTLLEHLQELRSRLFKSSLAVLAGMILGFVVSGRVLTFITQPYCELMSAHGFERAEPKMTVDSEAIFALAEAAGGDPSALEELRGSMATAWLDERLRETVFLARSVGRPLWTGAGRHELFFASTKAALEVVERALRLKLRKREVGEGTFVVVAAGRELERERFRPNRDFEDRQLPAVRAPHEGLSCLKQLAALAAL